MRLLQTPNQLWPTAVLAELKLYCSAPRAALPPMVDRSALAHALAGATASGIAMALFYPLDQLRVHEQLASSELSPWQRLNILKALRMRLQLVGFAGLYQGLPSSLVAIVWANFAYACRTGAPTLADLLPATQAIGPLHACSSLPTMRSRARGPARRPVRAPLYYQRSPASSMSSPAHRFSW